MGSNTRYMGMWNRSARNATGMRIPRARCDPHGVRAAADGEEIVRRHGNYSLREADCQGDGRDGTGSVSSPSLGADTHVAALHHSPSVGYCSIGQGLHPILGRTWNDAHPQNYGYFRADGADNRAPFFIAYRSEARAASGGRLPPHPNARIRRTLPGGTGG
jgi:hypothetical protein